MTATATTHLRDDDNDHDDDDDDDDDGAEEFAKDENHVVTTRSK